MANVSRGQSESNPMSSQKSIYPLNSPLLGALRPRQWTKNFIVFAAILFAFKLTWQSLWESFLAFTLFCAISSGFYLINDILDVESDRSHPIKCKRPIASGLVSIPLAIFTAALLLSGALLIGWWRSPYLGATILLYGLLQIAYNLRLKRTVILDVITIALGFVLRAYGGATATNISLSPWFILCTAMLAIFLAIEKRKAELRLFQVLAPQGAKMRSVLKRYSLPLLNRMESVVSTGAIITYALWSSGPKLQGASTPWMLITLPWVIYGIFRYQLLSDPEEIARRSNSTLEQKGGSESPDEILLTDKPILLTVSSWVVLVVFILGLKSQGIIH